jgi:diaminohydroxyphosphoribosylaminopyrimidine deaminase / 5-amino-6-(5-phosphoribosylamino)uracil reductase
MSDLDFMNRALQLAEGGRGYVEPNPLVGAVVVRDGRIIGEGWHQRYGEAHAEVNALGAAGAAARSATLYVTLEPCCHHGKTPPCTDVIVGAGIRRVVAAMLDPFPQVAGKGVELLRAAGIAVDIALGETAARRMNAPYLKLLRTGRPYVHAKWAMTLDGKIATRSGDSKWITGEAARQRAHELRGRMDAIIIGRGTLIADDPWLTARPPGPRTAARIVLTASGELPASFRLLETISEAPVIVFTRKANVAQFGALLERGCEVVGLDDPEKPGVSVDAVLDELGRRRMTNVLVEGGAAVLGAFLDARAIDEVHAFVAPTLIGGRDALTPVAGGGVERIGEALRLAEWRFEQVGDDLLIRGWVADTAPGIVGGDHEACPPKGRTMG